MRENCCVLVFSLEMAPNIENKVQYSKKPPIKYSMNMTTNSTSCPCGNEANISNKELMTFLG